MSVRKRTWFTRTQLAEIKPEAERLAGGKPWKTFTREAAERLGIAPQESWIVHYGVDGTWHIKTFERKKDADEFHDSVRTDVRKGLHTAPSRSITVAEAAERWIKAVEARGRERTTVRQYRQHVDLHIVPRIGKTKLADLKQPTVEDFRDKLLESTSRPMARKVLTSLKSLLRVSKHAHVADDVKIESSKRSKRKLQAGRDIPEPAEIKRLIAAATDPRKRALLLVAALTGLRASELRGLRWSDVDLKTGELHVRQRADRYGEIGNPKSDDSTRTLPLAPELLTALKTWKLACPKGEANLVFPTSTGHIEHHANMLRGLGPVMKAAGVVHKNGKPRYALHAFRHFFASWCINPKERGGRELPAKVVQELLGHSSIAITLDIYGHLFKSKADRKELADAAAVLLG